MWKSLARFVKYIKPYWLLIILGTIAGVFKFCLDLIEPFAVRHLLDVILGGMEGTLLGLRVDSIHVLFTIMLSVYVFRIGATFLRTFLIQFAANKVMFDIRLDLYQHIQKLSLRFFETKRIGAIGSRILNDINEAIELINRGFVTVIMDISLLSIAIGTIMVWNWKLAFAALLVLPLYGVLFKFISRSLKRASRSVQEEYAEMHGELYEKLAAVKVVQSFTREKLETENFWKRNMSYLERIVTRIKLRGTLMAFADFLIVLGNIIVLWYGGYLVQQGEITIGTLIGFYVFIPKLFLPIRRFADVNDQLQMSMASIDRVIEFFDEVPDVKDPPRPVKLKEVKGRVEFEKVFFAYDPAGQGYVLNGVSFSAEPGESVALVGESGSGKTTIANLIPRFYDPISGRVLIDGTPVDQIRVKRLRKHIGIVLQESILFSGTIMENLLYGKIDAMEREVIEAAKMAYAHEFIMETPEGYQTVIGERGVRLSGGQRQRIAIARAFLRDPRILILDEATSSLDSRAENIIQEALEKLMKGRTTFVIAHRLSTIAGCDKIVVLDQGVIVETGRHDELLALNGTYSRLYHEQFDQV